MIARNNDYEEVEDEELWWVLDPPSFKVAHPDCSHLDPEEIDELREQFMDERFRRRRKIIVRIRRSCYCYTGIGEDRIEASPPVDVTVVAATGRHIAYRDIRTALSELSCCAHHFLEAIDHAEGNVYEALFGS
ncbi:hypothetical protein ABPG75_007528 [Micractinium tetrahymenae]